MDHDDNRMDTLLTTLDMKQDGLICGSNFAFSPDGKFLAFTIKHRIVIQKSKNLEHHSSYALSQGVDHIDSLLWAPDVQHLAAVCFVQGLVFIRKLDSSNWKCNIDLKGEAFGVGLLDFQWAPDSRHVLTTAMHYTQLTIWSLAKSHVTSFRNLCQTTKYKSFSSNGNYLALANCDVKLNTCLSIYDCDEWEVQERFAVLSKDLAGIEWCPNNSSIAVWDSPLYSNVYFYATNGDLLKHYSPDGIALGIQSIQWSHDGMLVGLINHKNTVRLLNSFSFGILLEENMAFSHKQHVLHKDCLVYYETLTEQNGMIIPKYELDKNWTWTTNTETSPNKKKLNSSTSSLASEQSCFSSTSVKFSFGGKFVACRAGNSLNQLWIWDLKKVSLVAVLVNLQTITDFEWDPCHERIAACTGGLHIYIWTPAKGCSIKRAVCSSSEKQDFKAQRISWNKLGKSFAIQDINSNRVILALLSS